MGNEYIFDEDDNSIEIDLKNVTWNVDMHGYPVYEDVVKVQNDLQEEQLRDMHLDLKQAWDEYKVLLEKYKFWDDINK